MLKKFVFILFFILFFLILFNLDLFAVDITFTDKDFNELSVSLPEDISSKNFIICQSTSTVVLITTDKESLQLYFGNNSYTNYNTYRLYVDIYYFDYDTNSFVYQKNEFFIRKSVLSSDGFSCLYCSENFLVYCQHDDYGFFSDNELIGYNSFYNLSVNYEVIENGYRIYTNYFNYNGIQPYWTAYIWTLDSTYIPLEDCNPIAGSGWESFDYYESTEDNISFRWYYDVSFSKEYVICFNNSLTNSYKYFTLDIKDNFLLNLHLSTTEQTTEPIYVLSNRYYFEGDYDISQDFLQNYSIEIAYRFR